MGFPEEIKRIRQRSLLTQTDFAEIVHVAYSIVNRWEKGEQVCESLRLSKACRR